MATDMTNDRTILERNVVELFNDHRLLDCAVKAVTREKGIGYLDALARLHRTLEFASDGTVRQLFEWAGFDHRRRRGAGETVGAGGRNGSQS